MPLTAEQKAAAVAYLTSLPPWKDGANVLNGLKDEHLVAIYNDQVNLQAADGVYNALKEYLGDATLTANAMPAAIAKKKADCACPEPKPGATTNTTQTTNAAPATAEDWLKAVNAPPAVVAVVTNALAIVDREKADLIGKLTANAAEPHKAALAAAYGKMDAADLRVLAATPAVSPAAPTTNQTVTSASGSVLPPRLQPLYIGGAGGGNGTGTPTTNQVNGPKKQEPLGLPTLNADYWKTDPRATAKA